MNVRGAVLVLFACGAAQGEEWSRLADLPNRVGVAGAFAGVSHDALLVAGGANFPEKMPWEGGQKVWHDAIYLLEDPKGAWKVAGALPRPLGYGVSVTHRQTLVCVGGGDAKRNYADAFRIEWKAGKLSIASLPPLPRPRASGCGVLLGDVLYVVGGEESPNRPVASREVYRIDLAAAVPTWEEAPPLPGEGRILATAAALEGSLYVAGGVALEEGEAGKPVRRYLRDAYRLDPAGGWKRIADLPFPAAAAPSPAPVDRGGFYLLGGDDGAQVGVAPQRHLGFRDALLRYDAQADRWSEAGKMPAPRVTTPCVLWRDAWLIPSGEMRPGVRSPEVWRRTR